MSGREECHDDAAPRRDDYEAPEVRSLGGVHGVTQQTQPDGGGIPG